MNKYFRTKQIKTDQIKTEQIKTKPIAIMNATQQSPAIFLLEARSWPSALSSYLEDGTLCCMLHTSVKFGVGITTGCYNWNPGTHKSIQALYSGTSRGQVCFAMDGQLVLDRQVAREAVDMRNSCCTALGAGGGMGLKYRKGLDIGVSAYGSGYCYLTAFAPGVRSRVARILGPLPLIADVLRMLRIFGDQYISARWQKIADGVYHVVPVKLSEAIPPKTFFLQGWNIMRDESETARVGVEFSHQYASYFAYKIQQISSVVGDILCLGVQDEIDVDERASDETGWLLRLDDVQDQTIVDLALDHANIDSKGKVACSDCGFYVNPLGHELRCFKKITANDNSSFRFWSAAWMGDVVHRRDVRLYVLISDTPKERMGDYEETFVRKEAQAAFYMSYPGPKVPARGSSVHSISSAFEASYRGSFRADYIRSMFGKLTVEQLPEYLRPFTKGL